MSEFIQLRCQIYPSDLVSQTITGMSSSSKERTRRLIELANLGVLFESSLESRSISIASIKPLHENTQVNIASHHELRVRVYSYERCMKELQGTHNANLRSKRFIELANRGFLFERALLSGSVVMTAESPGTVAPATESPGTVTPATESPGTVTPATESPGIVRTSDSRSLKNRRSKTASRQLR